MDAGNPMTPQNQQKREDRRRKRKAILAGGVVLGIGAAVTLAAWSDDVFTGGIFETNGKFVVQGSSSTVLPAAAGTFRDARTAPTKLELSFPVQDLTPGDTVYAPLAIRTTEDSTLSGSLTKVEAAATGAMKSSLTYTVAKDSTSCDGTSGSTGATWITGAPVNGVANLSGTAPALASAGRTPVQLCVAVTFPNTPEAKKAVVSTPTMEDTVVTWTFHATQAD